MGKHRWSSEFLLQGKAGSNLMAVIEICQGCGIIKTPPHCSTLCPPWNSTDKGEDTNTNRVIEAESIKELESLAKELVDLAEGIHGRTRKTLAERLMLIADDPSSTHPKTRRREQELTNLFFV